MAGIVDQLAPSDALSLVLFSDGACVPKALGPLSCADKAALKAKVRRGVRGGRAGRERPWHAAGARRSAPPAPHVPAASDLPRRLLRAPTCAPSSPPQIKSDVAATSGTNFQSGIDAGGVQLTGCQVCMEANKTQVENRIIFITGGWGCRGGGVAGVEAVYSQAGTPWPCL